MYYSLSSVLDTAPEKLWASWVIALAHVILLPAAEWINTSIALSGFIAFFIFQRTDSQNTFDDLQIIWTLQEMILLRHWLPR